MNREMKILRVTMAGAVANCLLTIVKVAAGIVGNSAAMVADGVHSLTDLISDFIVMVFVKISSKDSDTDHGYGHGKYETLATLIVSAMLLVVGAKLLYDGATAIYGHLHGDHLETPGMITLYMALLSIITKEILYRVTFRVGRKEESYAVMANAWHHRTDAISSVGSMVGIAGAIFLGDNWIILDPLAACIISFFIFMVSVKMAIGAVNELMEASLPVEEVKDINDIFMSVDGIEDVHELKTRRNGRSVIIDAHIVVNPHISVLVAHEMTIKAENSLRERFGSESQIYIHVEPSCDSL